jgi:hypothetical protein
VCWIKNGGAGPRGLLVHFAEPDRLLDYSLKRSKQTEAESALHREFEPDILKIMTDGFLSTPTRR